MRITIKSMRETYTTGQIVLLDEKYEVEVVNQTDGKLFTTIKVDGDTWQVMTYRLKPITQSKQTP